MKSKRKWKLDGPSVEEKVKELVSILEDGVKNFTYTPEQFKAMLEMKALMPHYSFRNIIVARAQYPNASYIASMKRWNELGRKVKKGSKAIRIFKPVFKKRNEEEDETKEVNKLVGFVPAPVYCYEQTEGESLPIDKVTIKLEGESDEAREIIEFAEQIAQSDDCPVTYGDADGANGYYRPSTHEIVVSDCLSVNHRCKTLVHELVHSKVHRYDRSSTSSEREVVAEGAAFVVCSYFGLDTSDYSFGYVNSWGRDDEEALLKYGSQICDISGKLINQFNELMEQKEMYSHQAAIA